MKVFNAENQVIDEVVLEKRDGHFDPSIEQQSVTHETDALLLSLFGQMELTVELPRNDGRLCLLERKHIHATRHACQ